jgi:hypothetical protein
MRFRPEEKSPLLRPKEKACCWASTRRVTAAAASAVAASVLQRVLLQRVLLHRALLQQLLSECFCRATAAAAASAQCMLLQ